MASAKRARPKSDGNVSTLYSLGESWTSDVTPAKARQLIEFQHDNRALSERVIIAYAADMRAGNWSFSPMPIIVDRQGRMFDGQHRMAALARTNKKLKFVFVVADYDEMMMTLDNGKKRLFSDILSIRGIQNSSAVAAAVSQYEILLLLQGKSPTVRNNATTNHQKWGSYNSIDEELWQEAARLKYLRPVREMKMGGSIGACFIAFYLIDKKMARQFVDAFLSGEGLLRGNPILTLRRTAFSMAHDKTRSFGTRSKLLMIVKAWNAWIDGADLHKFQLAVSTFPKINEPVQ